MKKFIIVGLVSERQVAWTATLLFTLASLAILMGWFESVYSWFAARDSIEAADLDAFELGQRIFPDSNSQSLRFRGVVAYAFGQALHYFVWLKAIPDQQHTHAVPTSFRQSYRLLQNDFGRQLTFGAVVATIAMAGAWIFMRLPEARALYFALAAYHGYLEIAGLSLVSFRKAA